MAFIKGKIETDREIVRKKITVGDSPVVECSCGCGKWFDIKSGKEVQLTFTTLGELMDKIGHPCGRHQRTNNGRD